MTVKKTAAPKKATKAPKPEEKKNPKGVKIKKEFEIQMSKDERIKLAETAYEHELKAREFSLEFEEEKEKWKSKIQAQLAKAGELRGQFYTNKRTRTLDAVMVKDYDSQEIRFYHKGEVIESRTMTKDELQMNLAETKPVTVKVKVLKTRDAGKAIAQVSGQKAKAGDIADVIRMETGRKTKTSSVDGATRT